MTDVLQTLGWEWTSLVWTGKGDGVGIFSISQPYVFIREMAGWLLLDAMNIYSSGLERDVSSLQVLGKFYMVEYYALSPLGDIS